MRRNTRRANPRRTSRRVNTSPVRTSKRSGVKRYNRLSSGPVNRNARRHPGRAPPTPRRALRRRSAARHVAGHNGNGMVTNSGNMGANNVLYPSNAKYDPRISQAQENSRLANSNLNADHSIYAALQGTGAAAAGGIQNVMNNLQYQNVKNSKRPDNQQVLTTKHRR